MFPEVWFCNSCGIMGRVPIMSSDQKSVAWKNDSDVWLRITALTFVLPNGWQCPIHSIQLPVSVGIGDTLTLEWV